MPLRARLWWWGGPKWGSGTGTAHYSDSSQISLRLLSGGALETIDRAFYLRRIAAAEAHRIKQSGDGFEGPTGWCMARAISCPGLVIDRCSEYFTLQTSGSRHGSRQGRDRELSGGAFRTAGRGRSGTTRRFADAETLPLQSGILAGEVPETVAVRMNGLKLHCDLLHGQKTGIFLDQRENYIAAARYGRGRALDCFTSSGGFALHLAARCDTVEAVDSSEATLSVAKMNCDANGIGNVELREADVFDLLGGHAAAHRLFDIVVLDPPAFAKSRQSLDAAIRGYGEINRRALQLLGAGGILVTCSCSHHLSEAALLEIVATASLDTGRKLRVLERRMQAQDHPVLLTVPETLYLKCLILEVI